MGELQYSGFPFPKNTTILNSNSIPDPRATDLSLTSLKEVDLFILFLVIHGAFYDKKGAHTHTHQKYLFQEGVYYIRSVCLNVGKIIPSNC